MEGAPPGPAMQERRDLKHQRPNHWQLLPAKLAIVEPRWPTNALAVENNCSLLHPMPVSLLPASSCPPKQILTAQEITLPRIQSRLSRPWQSLSIATHCTGDEMSFFRPDTVIRVPAEVGFTMIAARCRWHRYKQSTSRLGAAMKRMACES